MISVNQNEMPVTCIVPFYNEGNRVLSVLDTLMQSRYLSQIICVDDGSTDAAYQAIQQKYPAVELIRLNQNSGKSAAIARGLARARENNILLFDADLTGVDLKQLAAAIRAFVSSPGVDMLILRRSNDLALCRLLRIDIVLSGERLLRKGDLLQALETKPLGYQLELATNYYMNAHRKLTCWMPLSSQHTIKISKSGIAHGLVKEFKQHRGLSQYKGTQWYLKTLAGFCPREFGHERFYVRATRKFVQSFGRP